MTILKQIDPDPEREDETNEESPLLAGGVSGRETSLSTAPSVAPDHPKFLRVVIVSIICVFLIELGDYMLRAPFMRILEDAVCRAYFKSVAPSGVDLALPIPEEDCKIAPVQSELANLKGWDLTFSCIPGILLAVPYGILADKYGRRPVLILSLLGNTFTLAFAMFVGYYSDIINIRWFWAGNAFLLIGGGSPVSKAMFYAMLADVANEDKRAAIFFQLIAFTLLSSIIAIPFSWYLMKRSAWIAMLFGFVFLVLGTLSCFFLPETLERSKRIDEHDDDANCADDNHASSQPISAREKISQMLARISDSVFIFKSPMLFGLSITFLLHSLGAQISEFLFQLASSRFHWTLAEASFLIPIGSTVNIIWLALVLPAVYYVLSHKLHLRVMIKDLIVARVSIVFLVIGALAIAWGPVPGIFILGVTIFACGVGFPGAARSLVTSLVHPDEVSRLYAVLAVAETVGSLIYGPMLSKAFGWGLKLGAPWTGMSFIVVAALYVVLGLPVWLVKEPTPDMDVHG